MRKVYSFLLNAIFFTTIILIVIAISTIALTKKINDYATQYNNSLIGTVSKDSIPALALTKGIVSKIHVKTGDEVKKGSLVIEMTNPSLESELNALKAFPNNASAVTQAKVAQQKLDSMKVVASADGIVGDINTSTGNPVEELSRLLTIYSNNNIRLLAELTVDQYQAVQRTKEIQAYSSRLDQSFIIVPDILNPDEKTPLDFQEKKIGLFFKFKNSKDARSLLNNEDLAIRLSSQNTNQTNKPIDFFVNFWNSIFSRYQ